MALAPNQQIQYDQLKSAGASHDAAFNAAILVQPQSTMAPTQPTNNFTTSFGATNPQPVTNTQTPVQLPPTPAAPAPQPTATTQSQPAPQQGTQPLAMPASGSVVDLLNTAGVDSSQANRKALAQQYGIQGYDFSAAKNQELAKKFLEAYNANKSKPSPQSGAEASSALDSYFQDNQLTQEQDPIKSFMDAFGSMNPIEAQIYSQLSNLLSTTTNQQSLTDFWKQEMQAQGIPDLNMELADTQRIMDGTEDDIREEITNAGGFATESQVQAMTTARNKTLLKKATYLSNVLKAKNDYVDRVVSLTQADREQVSRDMDRKLGITTTLFNMSQSMQNAAKDNYKMIIDSVGWSGLANAVGGNKAQAAKIEKLFGLAPGELKALGAYKKPLTESEQLDLQTKQLQITKLKQDIAKGPEVSTQVVDVGGKKVLINSKTGGVIAEIGSGMTDSSLKGLALQKAKIDQISTLVDDPGLDSSVGPTYTSRFAFIDAFGAKSNFIAGVEQLRQQLTLDKLIEAKNSGATFGALSDGERQTLAAAATKLGSFAIKDDAGNVLGYRANEIDFKKELDNINNFAKLDFIIKGGDPSAVGVQQLSDGSLWTKNSDGSVTQLN